MKSRSSLSRAAAGRRQEWTDRSLPRHLRLGFRLGQAHRERRPQPSISYSQLQATDDLLLGLTFGVELEERALLPSGDARLAETRFDDWLIQAGL